MSEGSASDIPQSGISSEEEKSAFTEELSRNSGVLIEAEQDEHNDLVVSDLEEEGKVASEDKDFPGFEESSEDTSSHSVSTDQRTETSITGLVDRDLFGALEEIGATVQEPVRMSRFCSTARSEVERVVVDVVKKASERENMSAKNKAKLREEAVKGMETKFEIIELFSQTDSIEHLETINDVALIMDDVIKRFKKYDIMDVFKLHLPSTANPTIPRETVELITEKKENVCESVEFFRTWGQDYDLENINWTLEFLENSCQKDLRTKVSDQMNAVPEARQGGPTCFTIMMKLVTTTTDNAIHALMKRVLNLDLKMIS
eukprot:scaffold38493_cov31-Attheya_sp.AAC.1